MTAVATLAMAPPRDFIFTNSDYDQEEVKTSSHLAHVQANQRPEFVFIEFEHGADEKHKKDSRRVVRSRATAHSHRVNPRGPPRPDYPRKSSQSSGTLSSSRRTSTMSTVSTISSGSGDSSCPRHRKRSRLSPLHVLTSPLAGAANISRKRKSLSRRREVSPFSDQSDRSISPGPFEYVLPDPSFLDASMRDPFDTYPVKYKTWYGQLIQFWYNVVSVRGSRVVKADKSELDRYFTWSRRQEMLEPALFYTALFLASGIPVAEGYFPLKAALWLRWKTVEAMKQAIADPKRSLSTPVILAVGRIALHEHIYGNRELAHSVHRPAQKRMIDLRGGLANLDIPGTTKQLIVWTDALLSAEAGTEPYFANVPKQIDIQSYTPQEAMHVTNYCSPKRLVHPGYDKTNEDPTEPE